MTAHALLQRFGIEHPILLAPMAGSGGTPELAAAVSNAGGLGAWGGAYAKPDDLAAAIRKIRQLTARPFNINLFAGGYATDHRIDPQPMLEIVAQVHAELGLPAPSLPPLAENPFAAQLEVVLEERPPVFSFTFGIPSAAQMAALKQRDIIVIGTATTAAEARVLAQLGVDAIVAQGAEAGAHRGTFAASFEDFDGANGAPHARHLCRHHSSGDCVRRHHGCARCSRLPESGRRCGAAWDGIFAVSRIRARRRFTSRALLAAKKDTTVITRAFSGRPARGLSNRFIAMVAGKEGAILPFRQQNDLTRPMRNAAGLKGIADLISLWAGQGVARSRAMPAADLVAALLEEVPVRQ